MAYPQSVNLTNTSADSADNPNIDEIIQRAARNVLRKLDIVERKIAEVNSGSYPRGFNSPSQDYLATGRYNALQPSSSPGVFQSPVEETYDYDKPAVEASPETTRGFLDFINPWKKDKPKPPEVDTTKVKWYEGKKGFLPPNAVPVGYTKCDEPLYAGRFYHYDLLPATVDVGEGKAYATYHGKVVEDTEFEILDCAHIAWQDNNDYQSDRALPIGKSQAGENLLFGRSHIDGTPTPGKFHASHRGLYIPYHSKELKITDYFEVMVLM